MRTIVVTGANGQLGRSLRRMSVFNHTDRFLFTDVDTLNLCNRHAVLQYKQHTQPAYILNCAAYTAVDKAETEEAVVQYINCVTVSYLAEAARAVGARLIHISTDYVFDGTSCRPYVETDQPHPVSAYGRTKLDGEEYLLQICPNAVIIRTAWLYSEYGHNFLKTMLRLGQEREELRVVFDQVGSPTYASDLAMAMLALIEKGHQGKWVPGIYHYSNEGVCSWYDFTVEIMRVAGLPCRVLPIESKEYPSPVARPPYSVLNKRKIKETYGLQIPHWADSLAKCIHILSCIK